MAPLVAWAIGVREDLIDFRAGAMQWRNAGALLIGPPGTGKTKASAAVAHYLGVNLIATSVATWMTYRNGDLGDFCSAVRNTFEEARRKAPVLVFIDECDALGQRGHSERDTWWNTAINAILEQLDGHADNSGIVVLGACNGGAETLDPALIRAGRLETHIKIGYPNIQEREAVLRFCLGKDLPAANLRAVAARLNGHPQATLAKIVADARRFARMASRPVSEADLELSLIDIAPPLKPAVVKRFCIHEAGHALVAMIEGLPVAAVAIGATGMRSTGAYTTVDTLHDETGDLASVRRFVRVLLAGRAAEALLLGVVSDGSGNDLLVATAELVRVHAASGLGPTLRWRDVPSDRFHALPDELAGPIERILQEEYANASTLLADHRDTLLAVVEVLEEERHIDGSRLTELFGSELPARGAKP
jgi:ATP-dependent Zn protease